MKSGAYGKYKAILEQMESDPEYAYLEERRRALESKVGGILSGLPETQRDILVEYYGLSQGMCLRALELACFEE